MDIFATIRTYWAEVLNLPKFSYILHVPEILTFFSTSNSSSRVSWGHFSKKVIFDPPKNSGVKNVCL